MSTAIADTSAGIHLNAADCIRRHPALSRVKLYRAAVTQQVRTQLRPGVPPLYCAADVDRLMAEDANKNRLRTTGIGA
jgi:hypothetical protein